MKPKYIITTNIAIIYGIIIIIINSINIYYVENATNSEYDPITKTGCIINKIENVKQFLIPIIVFACCIILLIMYMFSNDTQECIENGDAYSDMPLILSAAIYILIFVVSILMFVYGDDPNTYGNNQYHQSISSFNTTGCDQKLINTIYATIFINTLPGLITGIIIGVFIIGSILYGICLLIWQWLKTSCPCCMYDIDNSRQLSSNTNISGVNIIYHNSAAGRINRHQHYSTKTFSLNSRPQCQGLGLSRTGINNNSIILNIDNPPEYTESITYLPPSYENVCEQTDTNTTVEVSYDTGYGQTDTNTTVEVSYDTVC
jgi:hypothetical protein